MGENPADSLVVVLESGLAEESMLATWVPEKAKKRNMVVPTNSPTKATKSARRVNDAKMRGGEMTYDSLHYFPSR
jgi:hypothetical protein